MIWLWVDLDLDYLVLARNAPGHSWRNPAERVMSVVNLGFQTVGVMREGSGADMENKIKKLVLMFSYSIGTSND